MKKRICILALCLALCACAADTQSSSDEAVTTTTMTTTTTTEADNSSLADDSSAPDDSSKPIEKMGITAEVLSYKGGILTFKYEGEEYSLPFSRWDFDNDTNSSEFPSLSESIINNKYGETVYAKMSVAKDISKILKCDVVTPNGRVYQGDTPIMNDENGNEYVDTDKLYSFKRTEGTLCEISNKFESFELDLNELPMYLRLDYPETIDHVLFDCYQFKDGKTIFTGMNFNVKVVLEETEDDEIGVSAQLGTEEINRFGKILFFFGKIQNISDNGNTMTVLLNDKKTLCTVPTYYNDGGELKEGMEIMVKIIADSTLFGSGGEHEFDFAVIYTDPEYYNQTGEGNRYSVESYRLSLDIPVLSEIIVDRIEFDDLAYAECRASMFIREYTKVSEVE